MKILVTEQSIDPSLLSKGLRNIEADCSADIDKTDQNNLYKQIHQNKYDCIVIDDIISKNFMSAVNDTINRHTPIIIFSTNKNPNLTADVFESIYKNGSSKSYRQLMWAICAAARRDEKLKQKISSDKLVI